MICAAHSRCFPMRHGCTSGRASPSRQLRYWSRPPSHFIPPPRSASFRYCCAQFSWQRPHCACRARCTCSRTPEPPSRGNDRELPIYTIICALYREEKVVDKLVAAIRALDYPTEKLDVKFVLEADDHETRRALATARSRTAFRDHHRAADRAAHQAEGAQRGAAAGARPLHGRLRRRRRAGTRSAAARRRGISSRGRKARLPAGQPDHRQYRRQLAGAHVHRQLCRPIRRVAARPRGAASAVSARRLVEPFPHRRAAQGRRLGSLQRHRRCRSRHSSASARLSRRRLCRRRPTRKRRRASSPWLKQRTRWYKGWMQTWLVHMRRPLRLLRELVAGRRRGFSVIPCLQCAGGADPSTLHGRRFATISSSARRSQAIVAMGHEAPVFFATLLAGYASTVALDLIGLRRRGLLAHAWVLLLTPLYWFLLSLAAWRAVFQLLLAPQLWEKTEHGLAKSSRLAKELVEPPSRLNRLANVPRSVRQQPDRPQSFAAAWHTESRDAPQAHHISEQAGTARDRKPVKQVPSRAAQPGVAPAGRGQSTTRFRSILL